MPRILRNPLLYIIIIAGVLRLYRLSSIPAGFHVDEAKVAWEAHSIFKTGKDDWGHTLPLHYNTFGDFRPTGIFYASIPSIAVLGPTVLATRLPSAIFGILGVIISFYLVTAMYPQGGKSMGLTGAFVLAILPWHVVLSRSTSEGIMSLTMVMFGLTMWARKKYFPAVLFLAGSLFLYHNAILLTPIYAIIFLAIYPRLKSLAIAGITLVVCIAFLVNPAARGRLSQVSIFTDLDLRDSLMRLPFEEGNGQILKSRILYNKPVIFFNAFLNQYVQYLSPGFLITPLYPKPTRYSVIGVGLFSLTGAAILGLGLYLALKGRLPSIFWVLLLVSPIPAALTTEDVPNVSRSLFMIPWLIVFVALGATYVIKRRKNLALVMILILMGETWFFWHQLVQHNPNRYSIETSRNTGVMQLSRSILMWQTQYNQILVTNIPDSLYPWYATVNKLDPSKFNAVAELRGDHSWQWQNVVFTTWKCPANEILDSDLKHTMAINAEGCPDFTGRLKLITKVTRGEAEPYKVWATID